MGLFGLINAPPSCYIEFNDDRISKKGNYGLRVSKIDSIKLEDNIISIGGGKKTIEIDTDNFSPEEKVAFLSGLEKIKKSNNII